MNREIVGTMGKTVSEAVLVTIIAAVFYCTLQGQLPYHDALRFTHQIASGLFVWDIAHILLQPTALFAYKWSGVDPVLALKMLSSLSTAVAIGLFYLLLVQFSLTRWQAILGSVLLAACCSVITLAPSAHPKLVAFPFINGALLCLCMAERGGMRSSRLLVLGGILLALGASFLASVLATAPFATLAILFASRREGATWTFATRQSLVFAVTCGAVFAVVACMGFIEFTGQPLSIAGLIGSVSGKASLRPAPIPVPVHLARVLFGTVNNLVTLPELGATVQAWMRGQIPSLRPYLHLLPILALAMTAGLLVAATYLQTLRGLLRRRIPYMPVAFLLGAQTWTIWYGLNDPEHWFQLTAPTIALFLITMPITVVRIGLPAWVLVATTANLALLAVPVATYPLSTHESTLARMLGPTDMLVSFASYPGRAYAGFYMLPNVRRLKLDVEIQDTGMSVENALKSIDSRIHETLQGNSRVLVADILDPLDWEAPWMSFLSRGVTKGRLAEALMNSRTAKRLDDVGGIKLWELKNTTATVPLQH